MAKNGFNIFDSDTHVGPAARYLTAGEKQKLALGERYKWVDPKTGHSMYTRGAREYLRRFGLTGERCRSLG